MLLMTGLLLAVSKGVGLHALLRPRGAAGWTVGPIAIQFGHAEIDAPIQTDHPGIIGNRVIYPPPHAIVDHRRSAAEAARNGLRRPRQPRGLADVLDTDDLQFGVPEPSLIGVEVTDDAVKRRRIITPRHNAIVART